MVANSALLLLVRSLSAAMLMLVQKRFVRERSEASHVHC